MYEMEDVWETRDMAFFANCTDAPNIADGNAPHFHSPLHPPPEHFAVQVTVTTNTAVLEAAVTSKIATPGIKTANPGDIADCRRAGVKLPADE